MASKRYRALESRIRQIERRLLPSPTSTHRYTDEQYDQVRSYLLLCHAEVEACIEDTAWGLIDGVYRAFARTGRIRVPLLALLAHYQGELPRVPESVLTKPKKPPPDLSARIALAHAQYRRIVWHNHGVKEKNLLRLLLPVGLREADFPSGWLADMNTFGSDRGEIAHQSVGAVRQPPDPVTTKGLVSRVLSGLHQVDATLVRLR